MSQPTYAIDCGPTYVVQAAPNVRLASLERVGHDWGSSLRHMSCHATPCSSGYAKGQTLKRGRERTSRNTQETQKNTKHKTNRTAVRP